jgi:hypothetical protein
MFRQVFIVQCQSTGEFLTTRLNYTTNLNRAGYFYERQSAIDTGINEFDNDFVIYDFFKKESDLPVALGGGAKCPPLGNTGG